MGSAETIGYKIVFFKVKNNTYVCAISLDDIIDKNEISICNLILHKIGFPLDFDSDFSDILKVFGTKYTENNILEDCVSYNFLYNRNYFVSFNVSGKNIVGIEILCDSRIIDNRINCD